MPHDEPGGTDPIFVHDVATPRTMFGAGALQRLPDELERLRARRVLLLCTPGRAGDVADVRALLGDRLAGVFDGARLHVPADVVAAASAEAHRVAADACVAVGGGSAIGLAKALARDGGVPFIAIPTTYSGSEMTPVWGITEGAHKTTGRDAAVLPRTVIYDPLLTLSLPARTSAVSGMNAMAHCVEALYAHDADPVTILLAADGIRALADALPVIVQHPHDRAARATALRGAWFAGRSLAGASMGLHHRICHALGGRFDLPHAETHAVMLPHVVAFNAPVAPDAMLQITRALATSASAADAVHELAAAIGCPTTLRELGLREDQLEDAAEAVMATSYPNPRPYSRDDVRRILTDALG